LEFPSLLNDCMRWNDHIQHQVEDGQDQDDQEQDRGEAVQENKLQPVLAAEVVTSALQEVGASVELELEGIWVQIVFNLQIVDFLLENTGENVVNLKENDEGREVHRLINDALVLVTWRREHNEQNGDQGEASQRDSKNCLYKDESTCLRVRDGTRQSHRQVYNNLKNVSLCNEKNDHTETNSQNGVPKGAENNLASFLNDQLVHDQAEGERGRDERQYAHHV